MLGDPSFNVAFTTTDDSGLDIFLINDYLASQAWRMNGLQRPAALHFCVTRPNTQDGVTREQIASGMSWWLDATQALLPATA